MKEFMLVYARCFPYEGYDSPSIVYYTCENVDAAIKQWYETDGKSTKYNHPDLFYVFETSLKPVWGDIE